MYRLMRELVLPVSCLKACLEPGNPDLGTRTCLQKSPPLFVCRVIYDRVAAQDPKGAENGTGLQLLGVVVANKLPPYVPGCGVRKEE